MTVWIGHIKEIHPRTLLEYRDFDPLLLDPFVVSIDIADHEIVARTADF